MKTYKVCIDVVTYTRNFITIEADNEEAAILQAQDIWYEDDRAFSKKLMDESVQDIVANLEGE